MAQYEIQKLSPKVVSKLKKDYFTQEKWESGKLKAISTVTATFAAWCEMVVMCSEGMSK